jgi:hypothetical protein
MANIPIWDDNPGPINGATPFGYYDTDLEFQNDGPKVAKWCCRRIGYPIVDIELQSGSFYAVFEEAVNEYSAQVNQFNIRENMLNFQGATTGSSYTGREISDNLGRVVSLAEEYGEEAGAGGDVTWYSGSLNVTQSRQDYDFDKWATDNGIENGNIEIKRIFHNRVPAIIRYWDPYAGQGLGTNQMLNEFGWAGMGVGVNYLLTPVYADMLRVQEIEFSDLVRKSPYTFELINNKLRLFPVPTHTYKMFFQYILKSDRSNPLKNAAGVISDLSNVPYTRMDYTLINDPGKQWIKKYTLALTKEVLGAVRAKYGEIPIPGAGVSLDGDALRQEAITEKADLLEALRATLEEVSRTKQLENKKNEADYLQDILYRAPDPIYVK